MKTNLFLGLILIITLTSCKTQIATNYKIETAERNYYTNAIKEENGYLKFSETLRNGKLTNDSILLKDARVTERN